MKAKNNRKISYIPDEELTNFREVKAKYMAPGILYRSSSPLKGGDIKKTKGKLAQKAGIKCVINLDDHVSVLEALSKGVPWYHKLVKENNVIALHMIFSIPSPDFNHKLKEALQFMIAHEGPYLIHCFAGVDRTGFVVAILKALMGATIKEICDDYLLSFKSDYTSSYNINNDRKEIHLMNQLLEICPYKMLSEETLVVGIGIYLVNDVGLSNEEVEKLLKKLSGEKHDLKEQNNELCND